MNGQSAMASIGGRWLAVLCFLALLATSGPARAQCVLIPSPGNDNFVCSSGVSGSLTDLQGNNTLTFPPLGTGSIAGNVLFGPGGDTITMESGTITGTVDQGDGADLFQISAGTVGGSVTQGAGIDGFSMTGGQIASLFQGDALDVFFMSGGTITGAFEDGDSAVMTGGVIGRVDMNLANNTFDMSGGTIVGNLVTGFGDDTIGLSGGLIGGNLSVSGGADQVTVTGGSIAGEIRMSTGADVLIWADAGTIDGAILMEGDADSATLQNLSLSETSSTPLIDGGTETDALLLDNSAATGAARFANWEAISLLGGAEWMLDGTAILGDAGTGTGILFIGGSSTLFAGGVDAGVAPFSAGQLAIVTNAGTIDLSNGGGSAGDRFTVFGHYVGAEGTLRLDTVLAGDASPTDSLVISQGTGSGTTGISIVNRGGGGAATLVDGILVVQSINGATTTSTAFSLNGPVAAGAFEYFLFKGGVSAGTEENWYLRSTLVPGPIPAPAPQAGGIPFHRIEVPVYAALPAAARELTRSSLGTFHERRGSQSLLEGEPGLAISWGRFFGEHGKHGWSGAADPLFEGNIAGFQAGHDFARWDTGPAGLASAGFLAGQARLGGDVSGNVLGSSGVDAGDIHMTGTSFGAYWTQVGQAGWYFDAVAMATFIEADAASRRRIGTETDGGGGLVSLEGGYPIPVAPGWTLEPQAQVIWQDLWLDHATDRFSTLGFSASDGWTGRIGSRLEGRMVLAGAIVKPYFEINLWKDFSPGSKVLFTTGALSADRQAPALEFGAGLMLAVASGVSLFATGDYTTGLGDDEHKILGGNLGLRVVW